MRRLLPFALALSVATPATATSDDPVVFEDAGAVFLGPGTVFDADVIARGETVLFLDGFEHARAVHVDGAGLQVSGSSRVHTLKVTGDGRVTAAVDLEVVRVVARDDALVEGQALDVVLPPFPREFETPEEEEAWFERRLAEPPFIEAGERARLSIRSVTDDGIGALTRIVGEARVETLGHSEYIDLEMRDEASFVGPDMWGGGALWDRARVEAAEVAWGSFDLHDEAFLSVRNAGASTGAFSARLYDRSNATIENMIDGLLTNRGTGLLTVRDSMPTGKPDYQREVRVFLEHPQARVSLVRFGGPWSLNAPACGASCNPVYFVLGSGEYVRAEDSMFLMELGRVRFLELRESQALSLYAQTTTPPVRGECLLASGTSAASLVYERQCSRLRVSVVRSAGGPVAGATATLMDASGTPVPVYDAATGQAGPTRVTGADGVAVFDFAPRATPLKLRIQAPGLDRTVDVLAVRGEHDVAVRE